MFLKEQPDDATWREFETGYQEVAQHSPFTPQYRLLMLLLETARAIAYRLRSGNNAHTIPKELEYLRSLVS